MESLLKNIIGFNNSPIFGKSTAEIINEFLKIFKDLPGFVNAAYYYLETEDFEFSFKSSTFLTDRQVNRVYQTLMETGRITDVLQSGEITDLEIRDENDETINHLVVPLIASAGIVGMVLLSSNKSLKNSPSIPLIKIHSNYFATILENRDLKLQIENLKEVTEQKVALKTKDIAKSTRELKVILDSVQTGIIISDRDTGLIVDLNAAASKLIGEEREKLIGSPRKNYFFFTERKQIYNSSPFNQEGLLKTNEGILVPIIRTVKDVNLTNLKYSIESFMDISERKRMEDALHEARFELEQRVEERTTELLQANDMLQKEVSDRKKAEEQLLKLYWAVEQSTISIIITNLTGNIEYVNSYFSKITGYKFKDAMGNTFRELSYAKDSEHLHKEIWNNLRKGIEWRGEFKSRRKNGESYWVSATFSPIRNTEGNMTHFLSVQEDISERKRVEEELLFAKEKAEQSDKLKSTLLANMSHEFRTPLIGILGFSQILIDLVENTEQKEMVSEIQLSGKRLLNTLNGVLSISQLEATDVSGDFVKTDLAELIKSSSEIYRKTAESKNLKFNLNIKNDGLFSQFDVHLFQQALHNILDNAVKYTDSGSVSIQAEESENENRKWVLIKIIDTGIGISDDDKKIIFEAFRQASEGYTRNFEGCGLGLTIAKKIIETFGGKIIVEDGPRSGSVFNIYLPKCNPELMQLPEDEIIDSNADPLTKAEIIG